MSALERDTIPAPASTVSEREQAYEDFYTATIRAREITTQLCAVLPSSTRRQLVKQLLQHVHTLSACSEVLG